MLESVGGSGEIAISIKETKTSEQSLQAFTHSPNCSLSHSHPPIWAFVHSITNSITGSLVNDYPIH